MDYFDYVFHFLGLDSINSLTVNGTVTSLLIFIQNILNCIPKMNKAFTGLEPRWNQDGAAMFGSRPGRFAKTVLLFTFLLTFDFSFYTHNVCTDHLRQMYTLGHWKPLH